MECHKYMKKPYEKTRLLISDGTLEYTKKDSETPNILYIPNKGVLEYNIKTEKDSSFNSGPTAIKIAKEVLEGAHRHLFTCPKKTDLPEDKINKLIEIAKIKEKTDEDFQKKAHSLISLL